MTTSQRVFLVFSCNVVRLINVLETKSILELLKNFLWVKTLGRHKGRKMHFHRVIAYKMFGRTIRGNPESYWFTLDCGHEIHKFHSARDSMTAFALAVIIPDKVKKGEKLTVEDFPRMHCHVCARGEPHTEKAVDLNKFIEEIWAKTKKADQNPSK